MPDTSSQSTVTVAAPMVTPSPSLTATDIAQIPVQHVPKLEARWEMVEGQLICQWFHNPD